jgi:hypothetical protein
LTERLAVAGEPFWESRGEVGTAHRLAHRRTCPQRGIDLSLASPVVLDYAGPPELSVAWARPASSGWQCKSRPSGDDVAVTKRERIDSDVLHGDAHVAVLSGLARGDDVYDLMAAAAQSRAGPGHV